MADNFEDKNQKNSQTNENEIEDFFAEFDKVGESASAEQSRASQKSQPSAAAADAASSTKTQPQRAAGRKNKKGTPPVGGAAPITGKQKKVKKKSKIRTTFKIIVALILLMIIAGGIYTGVVIAKAQKIDPSNIYSELYQRSTIYDDNGKVLENVSTVGGNRDNVKYENLPKDLVNAVVALEDKTFWDHHGFNFIRMLGAIKDSVFSGKQISGTSTLTQQLARNVYLANIKSQRSLSRKITEAYYTVILEKNLSKEQIAEAYLNTIYLGFDSYGAEAASRAYFNKSVKSLTLLECASLAALPQSPDAYALIKSYPSDSTLNIDKSNIMATTDSMVYAYNGELSSDRRTQTLKAMEEQGYISKNRMDTALGQDLEKKVKVTIDKGSDISSYFSDYTIKQIADDIVEEYGCSNEEARKMIYTGGLKIYTTLDKKMQKTVESAFQHNYNFPGVTNLRQDGSSNILNDKGKVLLYHYDNYFNDKDSFVLKKNEYKKNADGGITILQGKRLNLFKTEVNNSQDISIEFKPMYLRIDYVFHTIENGALSIPQQYKTSDAAGNCVISGKFFTDYPNFFIKRGSKLVVKSDNYSLKQKVVQPQSSMVIMENKTGAVKAMVGGRNTEGKQLYNRAVKPRQPGSSIKPISVYSSALQKSYEAAQKGKGMSLSTSDGSSWGRYITAGSVINDSPIVYNGKSWPKNWYNSFRGRMTLRTAVQQSVNVCAVKTYQQIGPEYSASQLKKMGVTTLEEDGNVNDMNPAALALGGMTQGISPLEMAASYCIFPNQGTYTEPVAYTKILNADDEILFDKRPKTEEVLDPGVAYVMTDILRSVVTNGLGSPAGIGSQPVGGKTGTTSDNYDAWFVGFTPKYSAALWVGNDVNIELTTGSTASAQLWGQIMGQVCAGTKYQSFPSAPSNVVRQNGEYYVKGTYSYVPTPTYATQYNNNNYNNNNGYSGNGDNSYSPSTQTPTTYYPPTTEYTPPATNPPTQAPTNPPTTSPPTNSTTPPMEDAE